MFLASSFFRKTLTKVASLIILETFAMDQMSFTEKFLQAISISICVVNFLLTTRCILKAIELCKESVIVLNNEAVRKGQGVLRFLYEAVYMQMFRGFVLIGDHTSAIECCTKLLVLFRDCGAKNREAILSLKLSGLYQRQSKYEKAKELCMNVLSITIETGDKRGKGLCYAELGNIFIFVGDYAKALKNLEKALLIQKEIGDKDGEAAVNGNLEYVFFPATLGEMPSGRLIGFRQKLARGVVETSIGLNTNTLGGLGQQLYIMQPLFRKFKVSLIIAGKIIYRIKIAQFM